MKSKRKKVSWRNVHKTIHNLSKYIRRDHTFISSIVGISRGGIVPARYLSSRLSVRRVYTLGIEFYEEDDLVNFGEHKRTPNVYQGITHSLKSADPVLIVDDIVDSGESMTVAINEVKAAGATNIITCALHYKQKSSYAPDYYGDIVPNDIWIDYDWE